MAALRQQQSPFRTSPTSRLLRRAIGVTVLICGLKEQLAHCRLAHQPLNLYRSSDITVQAGHGTVASF